MAGNRLLAVVWTACTVGILSGCAFSRSVPENEWPGTYVASYSFGTDTLVINADHSFTQTVIVGKERVQHTGKWRAEDWRPRIVRIRFDGLLSPDDGLGNLNPDWRRSLGPAVVGVERIWWHVEISSGATNPYMKQ